MRCAGCGADNNEGARFCSSCGIRLPVAPLSPTPIPTPLAVQRPGELAARALVCPYCQHRTMPIPFFARGVNMAKALVLLVPFNFVGPLLYFFWRKDRFICTVCRRMLPLEAPLGLFDAFSPTASLAPGPNGEGLMPLSDQIEVASLEHRSQVARFRGWLLGATSAVSGGVGAAVVISGSPEPVGPFLVVSAATALGAVWSATRGATWGRVAAARRRRAQTLEIIQLAREQGGRLTVSTVAAHLRLPFDEAERALDSMVDGRRVDLQVDAEGKVTYVFPELVA